METLDLVKEVVKNNATKKKKQRILRLVPMAYDPTKDLINVLREEMDNVSDHELKLFHLLQSSKPSVNNAFSAYGPQQQRCSGIYQGQGGFCSREAPGSGMLQSLYNQWHQ